MSVRKTGTYAFPAGSAPGQLLEPNGALGHTLNCRVGLQAPDHRNCTVWGPSPGIRALSEYREVRSDFSQDAIQPCRWLASEPLARCSLR